MCRFPMFKSQCKPGEGFPHFPSQPVALGHMGGGMRRDTSHQRGPHHTDTMHLYVYTHRCQGRCGGSLASGPQRPPSHGHPPGRDCRGGRGDPCTGLHRLRRLEVAHGGVAEPEDDEHVEDLVVAAVEEDLTKSSPLPYRGYGPWGSPGLRIRPPPRRGVPPWPLPNLYPAG